MLFPDASNVVQVIDSSTAYFCNVYSHGKLIIEPHTQIPYNRNFAYIAISYPNSVDSGLFLIDFLCM